MNSIGAAQKIADGRLVQKVYGSWLVRYTVHPTPFTKGRIRASLGTKDLAKARLRRDQLLFVA
jgi:hypothetical protein